MFNSLEFTFERENYFIKSITIPVAILFIYLFTYLLIHSLICLLIS